MRVLWPETFTEFVTFLGVIGAVVSFVWAVWQWRDQAVRRLEAQQIEAAGIAETRRIDATKPFLDRQLKLYTEATQVVAALATTHDVAETKRALKRFWQLYWGELALVENEEVEKAMVKVKEALNRGAQRQELQSLSLNFAQACRVSLDRSWGIHAWTTPDRAAGTSGKR
jgi:hypothetical protein